MKNERLSRRVEFFMADKLYYASGHDSPLSSRSSIVLRSVQRRMAKSGKRVLVWQRESMNDSFHCFSASLYSKDETGQWSIPCETIGVAVSMGVVSLAKCIKQINPVGVMQ